MKYQAAAGLVLGALLATISASAQTPIFTPGDVIVNTYGSLTSNAYIDGNPVPLTLVEFSPTIVTNSTPVTSFQIPMTANGSNVGIAGEYGSSSEGNIQLSGDGQYLTVSGYNAAQATNGIGASSNAANGTNAPLGTPYSNNAGIPLAQSTDTDVNRVAVFVDAYGNVNSGSTYNNLFSTNNPRSVYSASGTDFYFSGQGSGTSDQGLYHAQIDQPNTKSVLYNTLDTRFTQVFQGNLYYSIDKKSKVTGIFEFVGTPTSAATATQITAAKSGSANLSPEGFFFANATTLYIADTGVPKNGGTSLGGIQKWSFNGTTWNLLYTFPNPSNFVSRSSSSSASHGETGFAGIAGKVVNGVASLYGVSYTAGDADGNGLYGIADTVSATALGSQTFVKMATAPGVQSTGTSPDYVFKGVSLAPQPTQSPDGTPAMPTWLLALFGVVLFAVAARFIPLSPGTSRR